MTEGALTSGQRWTAEQLAELRRARFAPRALGGFLAASFRRSAQVRAARPHLVRQSRRWMAAGAVAWLVLTAARVEPFHSRRRAGPGWWTVAAGSAAGLAQVAVRIRWRDGDDGTDGEPP